MNIKHLFFMAVVSLLLASCGTTKDVPYLIDAGTLPPEVLKAAARSTDPTVMAGDLLYINVSGPDAEVVKPFNKGLYLSQTGSGGSNSINNGENSMLFYLVDNNGYIDFPLLGKLRVAGMTKSATEDYIASQIYPRYLTVKPGVEVRFENFHVYTMGEVNNPGMVKANNGRLNILEALAMSGDLTIKGRRDNIMIVRTNADGSRSVKIVNLNDKNLIVSNDFMLQQNDIIYVEPNASKARSSWNVPPALSLGMSSVGTLISIATFIITLTK
ncbi:MAG: polysaccharide biosynthesis/export family protein [Muribaculaceae bacterium]|nr:polysaccharide biosynthesis/export family protein [Muribaculaceae bacterium]